MTESDRRLWPFKRRSSILSAMILLIVLLGIVTILRVRTGWPSEKSESAVLIGVLLLSLLPVLLAVLDVIIERGGVIEHGGVKIDFSQVRQMGVSGVTVPVNIGVRGESVTDSSTTQVLDALKQATACDVVTIDLEEGQAWWETRLLVLLAGAARLRKPDKIVFVGTDAGKQQCFQGWAHPSDLLPHLLQAHPQYLRSLHAARAAARQWELVEPVNPVLPGSPGAVPAQPPWMQVGLTTQHPWMAFDGATGLPNELLAEQLLATDLGARVESEEDPKRISLVRLEELFRPVLNKDSIDQSWPVDRQISTFFDSDSPYIAVTQNGRYSTLISRLLVLNEVLRIIVERMPVR
jgi:hypothetical protein